MHRVSARFASSFSFAFGRQSRYLHFDFAARVIPHPEKAAKGGEDAFFASKRALAVADGVGGWADSGVDPALYSRSLMQNVGQQMESNPLDPKAELVKAAAAVKETGTSTACVLILDDQAKCIRSANLGDSGYLVFRTRSDKTKESGSSIIYSVKSQQHYFNCPFQCGSMGDDPIKAEDHKMDIHVDDVILMATDGLWDNVFPEELESIYEKWRKSEVQPSTESLAKSIADQAYTFSLDRKRKSPFTVGAMTQGYSLAQAIGGKSDDITVLIGRVME
eukprot:GILJ01003154.1.p1 GENE.GILJ01003154.1~~GILJ01003154.1.p1  ORF type:complete len:277 (-),score=47.54 GILJ01003154.1:182-1012(-)